MPIQRRTTRRYSRPANAASRTNNSTNARRTIPRTNLGASKPATFKSNSSRLPGMKNLGGCAPCRKAAQMRAAARAKAQNKNV